MDNSTWNSSVCNETIEDCFVTRSPIIQKIYDVVVPSILVVIMIAMGAGITLNEVKDRLKVPISTCVGLVSIFILMPAMSFGVAHALQMEPNHAIGMMIVACCPGGTVSNIFTLWSRGDLALSVVMTALSTVLAVGFMPLNLFIYLRSWTSDRAKVPFVKIVVIVAMTWIPVFIGIIIRRKAPKVAGIFTKIGSVLGLSLIVAVIVMQRQLYPEVFGLPWQIWVGGIILPILGYVLGMGTGAIARRSLTEMRTIGYENGIKNVGLALTIINMSYSGLERAQLIQYPMVYSIFQLAIGFGVVMLHRLVFVILDRKQKSEKETDTGEHLNAKLEKESFLPGKESA